uniref:Uncharacterized protein n=1 Tax=Lutzomyia longipalpis TaxID=7200 RepID=A0A1B0GHV5_LUTLO
MERPPFRPVLMNCVPRWRIYRSPHWVGTSSKSH